MGRAILAVMSGWLAIYIAGQVLYPAAHWIMGTEGWFKEGSFELSLASIVVSFVLLLVLGWAGGMICADFAPRPKPLFFLIGCVLVTGFLSGLGELDTEAPGARSADLSMVAALRQAARPAWLVFVSPLIVAVGIWFGGKRARAGSTREPG